MLAPDGLARAFDAVELGALGAASQAGAQVLGSDHNQASEFVDRLGAADQDALAGNEDLAQRFAQPRARGARLLLSGEGGSGGLDGVDGVVLFTPRSRFPPGISTTSSPAWASIVAGPAAKLPVPSSATPASLEHAAAPGLAAARCLRRRYGRRR
jgi:hypothetical protein